MINKSIIFCVKEAMRALEFVTFTTTSLMRWVILRYNFSLATHSRIIVLNVLCLDTGRFSLMSHLLYCHRGNFPNASAVTLKKMRFFFIYIKQNNNVGFTPTVAFVINNGAKIGWQRVIPACITLHPSHVRTPKCVPFARSPHTWHSSSSSPTSSTSGLSNRKKNIAGLRFIHGGRFNIKMSSVGFTLR